jgi:hypothetical protein
MCHGTRLCVRWHEVWRCVHRYGGVIILLRRVHMAATVAIATTATGTVHTRRGLRLHTRRAPYIGCRRRMGRDGVHALDRRRWHGIRLVRIVGGRIRIRVAILAHGIGCRII